MTDFSPSLGFEPIAQSSYLQTALLKLLQSPQLGTPVEHYKAQLVEDETFDKHGQPDYLAKNAGDFESGVQYISNPRNPLRGIFCRSPLRPNQETAGITYQAEMDLYLPVDPGDVFVLQENRPKRQDRFDIQGGRYYAIAPTMPCVVGEVVSLWKVQLSRERYPVRLDSQGVGDGIRSQEQGWNPWDGF